MYPKKYTQCINFIEHLVLLYKQLKANVKLYAPLTLNCVYKQFGSCIIKNFLKDKKNGTLYSVVRLHKPE